VDVCPVAPFGSDADILWNYRFKGGTALGMCSLYNHNDNENLDQTYETFGNFEMKRYYAKRDILKGEELSINYGNKWFSSRELKSDNILYYVTGEEVPNPTYYYYGPSFAEPRILGVYFSKPLETGDEVEQCMFISNYADFVYGKKTRAISVPLLPSSECKGFEIDECPKGCLRRKEECWECTNNVEYFDVYRSRCAEWEGFSCDQKTFDRWNYTKSESDEIMFHCPAACNLCERHPLSATHRIVFGNCAIYNFHRKKGNVEMVLETFAGDRMTYSVRALRPIKSNEELVLDHWPFQSQFTFELISETTKAPIVPEVPITKGRSISPPPRMLYLLIISIFLFILFKIRFFRRTFIKLVSEKFPNFSKASPEPIV